MLSVNLQLCCDYILVILRSRGIPIPHFGICKLMVKRVCNIFRSLVVSRPRDPSFIPILKVPGTFRDLSTYSSQCYIYSYSHVLFGGIKQKLSFGEMAEWLIALVLKTSIILNKGLSTVPIPLSFLARWIDVSLLIVSGQGHNVRVLLARTLEEYLILNHLIVIKDLSA